MNLNDFKTLLSLATDEPKRFGAIEVSTTYNGMNSHSLHVEIWDGFRLLEKEYDVRYDLLLSRQVTTQYGDVFGEERGNDQKMHKYAYISECSEDADCEICKEYYDGRLINTEYINHKEIFEMPNNE